MERTPGRKLQTLADASFEAWTKYYQPDENTPNQAVSYYVKGALVALCLDLLLRLRSKVTLDDVMRALWRDYGARHRGVPEGGLEKVAQQLSKLDLKPFFDAALRSTAELPLTELLAEFGVRAVRRAAPSANAPGGRATGSALAAVCGFKLKADLRVAQVFSGGAAARAGLAVNDQLIALDGLRLTNAARLQTLTPGRRYSLSVFRDDELQTLTLMPEAPSLDTWTLTLDEAASDAARTRRAAWLATTLATT